MFCICVCVCIYMYICDRGRDAYRGEGVHVIVHMWVLVVKFDILKDNIYRRKLLRTGSGFYF